MSVKPNVAAYEKSSVGLHLHGTHSVGFTDEAPAFVAGSLRVSLRGPRPRSTASNSVEYLDRNSPQANTPSWVVSACLN